MVQEVGKLIIVLDSNEYIRFLNEQNPLLGKIFSKKEISVYTTDLIVREVLRNLKTDIGKEFYKVIEENKILFYPSSLYYSLFKKYKDQGFKKGDIIIASFCEGIMAKYLITENRHFLKSKAQNFQILSLKEFLKKFGLI
ncbi:hypothetical protein HYV89_04245 [Candidatus Woesearchaeota archaeon]|nr:hypothetical protein [Candidatus Woesearchaeota archaeon]